MTAVFYLDRDGSCKLVQDAIQKVRDVQQAKNSSGFFDEWALDPPRPFLGLGNSAFVMNGTTPELTAYLDVVGRAGLLSIAAEGQVLALWYVRWQIGGTTRSLISVAPLVRYWGLVPGYAPLNDWKQIWPQQNNGVSLVDLMRNIVPCGEGVKSWLDYKL
jgi:hypothetical protein